MLSFKKHSDIHGIYKIFNNNIEVGIIHYRVNIDVMEICNLEIHEEFEGYGYGRLAINQLLQTNRVNIASGISVEDSRGFWVKMGAKFKDGSDYFQIDCNKSM
jgi:hypothetical protein